jgi:hypothetical protein
VETSHAGSHGGFADQVTLMNATEVPDRTGERTQWQAQPWELSAGSEQPAARILPIGLPTSFRRWARKH